MNTTTSTQRALMRRTDAEEKRALMAAGVRLRSHIFRPKKGRGSYVRKRKHREAA